MIKHELEWGEDIFRLLGEAVDSDGNVIAVGKLETNPPGIIFGPFGDSVRISVARVRLLDGETDPVLFDNRTGWELYPGEMLTIPLGIESSDF